MLRLAAILAIACGPVGCSASPRYVGGDVSMLPELERRGAVYHDPAGAQVDAIRFLQSRGWNLFRVRVFVDPSTDFASTWGATQDLVEARALARRIRAAGGEVLLCIHYSDSWADPQHQTKPRAWAGLSFDSLEQRVHDYTAEVLAAMKSDGVVPSVVQVGNEITAGMLWPDGQIAGDDIPTDFARLATLLRAGIRAVREASTPQRPIRVALHIHGGGQQGVPTWFFDHLSPHALDFDIIALSVYPAWGDSLDVFAEQSRALVHRFGKDILVAETSYPHRSIDVAEHERAAMRWPASVDGQVQFVKALNDSVRSIPQGRGIGVVWWYPEAIPMKGIHIYKNGAEGVFDETGRALPAVDALRAD
jgi:arabinogalactan endo-1,4-beta-galactosidase